MSGKGKFVKGGIIGAIVGVISGLLFAPKSGKETRKDIKDAANKFAKEAEVRLKKLYEEMIELKDKAEEKAKELQGKAAEEWDEISKRAEIAKVKLGELITAVREGQADDE